MYGETDFFWRKNADNLIKDGILREATVFTVPAAGHHPYIDNPTDTANYMIDNFLKFESQSKNA